MLTNDEGSALVSTVAAMLFLLLLFLGVIQVAWTLYARNVTMASAHEAARAAVEHGAETEDAVTIAEQVLRRAAGGLIENLRVAARDSETAGVRTVRIAVSAELRTLGPVPFSTRVTTTATASTLAEIP